MTGCPEYKLAREAEMAYCTIAMVRTPSCYSDCGQVTDYDCWHPHHDHVTVELVMKNLKANGELAQHAAKEIVRRIAQSKFESLAHSALAMAIVTPKADITPETRKRLGPIIAKYV
jgi:5'-methylthioadenosine phosphorylase